MKCFPEDVDLVERYVFGYNRFISGGQRAYIRVQLFHCPSTNVSSINSIVSTFRQPRMQFFSPAHSNAISPLQIGTLTGSVAEMTTSEDFHKAFKNKFKLRHLGLWWTQPRRSTSSSFSKNKFTVHIEIDSCDESKVETIDSYFNSSKVGVDNCFWGIPMQFVPMFRIDLGDDEKERIDKHAHKQEILGKSLKSVSVHGIQLNNWTSKKHHTLFRQLMLVESLYDKQLASSPSDSKSTFNGRLFYAIIPHLKSNKATFYYTAANYDEGRSVARGLPRFIKSYFGLDPKFFCSSKFLAEAKQVSWSASRRSFLTMEEKLEDKKLDSLETMVTATKPVFISKDHQRALAINENDAASEDSKLTKGDATAPAGSVSSETGADIRKIHNTNHKK